MARTPSNMLPLGTALPAFSLPDAISGQIIESRSLSSGPAVVVFTCPHCPYAKHIRAGLAEFGRFCRERGVRVLAINSNDAVASPDDSPAGMRLEAKEAGYDFPYVIDETQDVARAFDAACTPDLYVFDASAKLAYRGQFDDSRPSSGIAVTGRDARAAVEALLAGHSPTSDQRPSLGCNIKWRAN